MASQRPPLPWQRQEMAEGRGGGGDYGGPSLENEEPILFLKKTLDREDFLPILDRIHTHHPFSYIILGRRQNSLSVTTNKPQRMTNIGD